MFANGYGNGDSGSCFGSPPRPPTLTSSWVCAPRSNITDVVIEPESVGGKPQFLMNEPDEWVQVIYVESLSAGLQRRDRDTTARDSRTRAGEIGHPQGRLDLIRDGGTGSRRSCFGRKAGPTFPPMILPSSGIEAFGVPGYDREAHGAHHKVHILAKAWA